MKGVVIVGYCIYHMSIPFGFATNEVLFGDESNMLFKASLS